MQSATGQLGSFFHARQAQTAVPAGFRRRKTATVVFDDQPDSTPLPTTSLQISNVDQNSAELLLTSPEQGFAYEVFIDDLRVPAKARVGEEGRGFRYLLDGLNPERILLAHEAVGEGALDHMEAQFIDHIFEFGNRTLEDIMTPRSDIHFLSDEMTVQEMLAAVQEANRSAALTIVETGLIMRASISAIGSRGKSEGAALANTHAKPIPGAPDATGARPWHTG